MNTFRLTYWLFHITHIPFDIEKKRKKNSSYHPIRHENRAHFLTHNLILFTFIHSMPFWPFSSLSFNFTECVAWPNSNLAGSILHLSSEHLIRLNSQFNRHSFSYDQFVCLFVGFFSMKIHIQSVTQTASVFKFILIKYQLEKKNKCSIIEWWKRVMDMETIAMTVTSIHH